MRFAQRYADSHELGFAGKESEAEAEAEAESENN
jgi:hypothetical protein